MARNTKYSVFFFYMQDTNPYMIYDMKTKKETIVKKVRTSDGEEKQKLGKGSR